MWIIRLLSILFFIIMSMNKINILSIDFINREVLHYIFNGSVLFLAFTFLLPLSTNIKLLTWSAKESKSIQDFIPNIKLPIDIHIAKNIFSNNAVTLNGWKKPIIF